MQWVHALLRSMSSRGFQLGDVFATVRLKKDMCWALEVRRLDHIYQRLRLIFELEFRTFLVCRKISRM